MANSDSWVKEFRKAIKSNIGSGWQVSNDRGNMRLLYGSKETGRTSINLPFSWQENQWFEAFKFIEQGAEVFKENNGKIPLKTCFLYTKQSSSERVLDWERALINYRKEREDIGEKTWKTKHLPVLEGIIFYMTKAKCKPDKSRTLFKKVFNEYRHGRNNQLIGWPSNKPTQKRHMRLAFNKFLDYCCNYEDFPSCWRPEYGNFQDKREEENISRNKRIGYPLTDSQIGRLVDNFPDNPTAQKWKFAVQLCAVYGLRPEELNHLVIRYGDDKPKLWCTYHKANSRFKERQLLPLMVLDIDGKPFDWCRNLVQRLGAGEQLPNIPKGNGGQYLGSYLRRRSIKNIWLSICAEAEAEAQECTPYSFRHRYAYVAHTRPTEKGLYRSPNQIANSMGHDLNTHTVSYARFEISDLEEVFDLVEV